MLHLKFNRCAQIHTTLHIHTNQLFLIHYRIGLIENQTERTVSDKWMAHFLNCLVHTIEQKMS